MTDRPSLIEALDELSGKLSSRPLTAAEAEDAVTLIFEVRRALGAYVSAVRSGERESDQMRELLS